MLSLTNFTMNIFLIVHYNADVFTVKLLILVFRVLFLIYLGNTVKILITTIYWSSAIQIIIGLSISAAILLSVRNKIMLFQYMFSKNKSYTNLCNFDQFCCTDIFFTGNQDKKLIKRKIFAVYKNTVK